MISYTGFHSPLGEMVLAAHAGKLVMCDCPWSPRFERNRRRIENGLRDCFVPICAETAASEDGLVLNMAEKELEAYLGGTLRDFTIPLEFVGTGFQRKVWEYLRTIPYGTTISYSEEAAALGCPGSVRAVAGANGNNAICIIAACHRVIGKDGSLGGYAGGLEMKKILIELEANSNTNNI